MTSCYECFEKPQQPLRLADLVDVNAHYDKQCAEEAKLQETLLALYKEQEGAQSSQQVDEQIKALEQRLAARAKRFVPNAGKVSLFRQRVHDETGILLNEEDLMSYAQNCTSERDTFKVNRYCIASLSDLKFRHGALSDELITQNLISAQDLWLSFRNHMNKVLPNKPQAFRCEYILESDLDQFLARVRGEVQGICQRAKDCITIDIIKDSIHFIDSVVDALNQQLMLFELQLNSIFKKKLHIFAIHELLMKDIAIKQAILCAPIQQFRSDESRRTWITYFKQKLMEKDDIKLVAGIVYDLILERTRQSVEEDVKARLSAELASRYAPKFSREAYQKQIEDELSKLVQQKLQMSEEQKHSYLDYTKDPVHYILRAFASDWRGQLEPEVRQMETEMALYYLRLICAGTEEEEDEEEKQGRPAQSVIRKVRQLAQEYIKADKSAPQIRGGGEQSQGDQLKEVLGRLLVVAG